MRAALQRRSAADGSRAKDAVTKALHANIPSLPESRKNTQVIRSY
jgi:hypothetical protein